MYGDDHKHLFTVEFHVQIAPRERWIGLRRVGNPAENDQSWLNRKGSVQDWELNLLPCIGIFFKITHWTSTKEKKKKK